MVNRSKSTRPSSSQPPTKLTPAPPKGSADDDHPVFCLRYLHPDHSIDGLSTSLKADLTDALFKRAQMTWQQIKFAPKHGLGFEKLPREAISKQLPAKFEDLESFLVLRYSGKLPMIGTRVGNVFHILFIENTFGSLYGHGG
jgi:hypothetical protein